MKKKFVKYDASLIEGKKQSDFAKRLKERREYLSISQEKLAIDMVLVKQQYQTMKAASIQEENMQYPCQKSLSVHLIGCC